VIQPVNGKMSWTDISQKKKYKSPINACKNTQHLEPPEKFKSKLH
jgi:hypothetical protein